MPAPAERGRGSRIAFGAIRRLARGDGASYDGDQPGVQGAVIGRGGGPGLFVQIVGESQVHMPHGTILGL
jgi:hypothetical protein